MRHYTRSFDRLSLEDVALGGGKTASLGEMYGALRPLGVKVPGGGAITAGAYWAILAAAGLRSQLRDLLEGLDKSDVTILSARGRRARSLVRDAGVPAPIRAEIADACQRLCQEYGAEADVAVRSSATAEDLPTASFADQQGSFLNVRGLTALREAVSHCFASLFTDRAVSYRVVIRGAACDLLVARLPEVRR